MTERRDRWCFWLVAAWLTVAAAGPARAAAEETPAAEEEGTAAVDAEEGGDDEDDEDPPPNRWAWLLLPAIGGNTDVGFIFGALGILTRFTEGFRPYEAKYHLEPVASVKDGPGGAIFPEQNLKLQLDFPGLAGDRLRIFVKLFYKRTSNAGYFGLADAYGDPPAGGGARRYQFVHREVAAWLYARTRLVGPLDLMSGLHVRYLMPVSYAGSKFAEDRAARHPDGAPVLLGTSDHAVVQLAAGLLWDSRDDEFVPTAGMFHELSLRGAVALPPGGDPFWYGSLTAHARWYLALLDEWLVLATHVALNFLFGDVPFHELSVGGVFFPEPSPGGPTAIRGVPRGRYGGRAKLLTGVELRSMFWRFRLFGKRMFLGAAVFADVGYVWLDPVADRPVGPRSGVFAYGVGGGVHLRWGEPVFLRIEVAYAPEAQSVGLPVGIYMALGHAY